MFLSFQIARQIVIWVSVTVSKLKSWQKNQRKNINLMLQMVPNSYIQDTMRYIDQFFFILYYLLYLLQFITFFFLIPIQGVARFGMGAESQIFLRIFPPTAY